MKLTVKTLKGSHFEIRFQPSDTVSIRKLLFLFIFYVRTSIDFADFYFFLNNHPVFRNLINLCECLFLYFVGRNIFSVQFM